MLPAMSLAEALETTRIHRVAGLTGDRTAVVTTRPGGAPYLTILDVDRVSLSVHRRLQGLKVNGACAMAPTIVPVPGAVKAASHR